MYKLFTYKMKKIFFSFFFFCCFFNISTVPAFARQGDIKNSGKTQSSKDKTYSNKNEDEIYEENTPPAVKKAESKATYKQNKKTERIVGRMEYLIIDACVISVTIVILLLQNCGIL